MARRARHATGGDRRTRLRPRVLLVGAAVSGALALAACGAGERQDAGAPAGTFGIDVTRASFPARQTLAQPAVLRLDVRNTGRRSIPDLAVTVETAGRAPEAFATEAGGAERADTSRPAWILDAGPAGGTSAYVGTWALGPLARGETRRVRFALTAVRAGRYTLRWRVSPALEGDVRVARGGSTEGTFRVTITEAPAALRVGPGGRVIRGGG